MISNNKGKKLSLLSLMIVAFYFVDLFSSVLSMAFQHSLLTNVVCNVLLLVLFCLTVLFNYKRIKPLSIIVIIFCFLSVFLTLIFRRDYEKVMIQENNVWDEVFGFRSGLFLMFVLTLEDDSNAMLNSLRIGAFFYFVNYTIKFVLSNDLDQYNSNHAYGYRFMFVSIVYFVNFFKNKKPFYLILSIVSSIEMIMVGARTTLVAFVLFFVLYYLFNDLSNKSYKKAFKKVFVSCLMIALTIFILSDFSRRFIASILNDLNVHSKIINSILSGNNALDGGRVFMYDNDFQLLKNNFFGLGVYWDRFVYYGRFTYTHNFFYEIMLDYGWLLGGTILILLVFYSIKILIDRNTKWKSLYIVFLSLWCVRLTLSFSFWLEPTFWASVAIIIQYHYSIKTPHKLSVLTIHNTNRLVRSRNVS